MPFDVILLSGRQQRCKAGAGVLQYRIVLLLNLFQGLHSIKAPAIPLKVLLESPVAFLPLVSILILKENCLLNVILLIGRQHRCKAGAGLRQCRIVLPLNPFQDLHAIKPSAIPLKVLLENLVALLPLCLVLILKISPSLGTTRHWRLEIPITLGKVMSVQNG